MNNHRVTEITEGNETKENLKTVKNTHFSQRSLCAQWLGGELCNKDILLRIEKEYES